MANPRRYKEWKAAGLCPYCGREKPTERFMCDQCLKKHAKYLYRSRVKKIAELRRQGLMMCKKCHNTHKEAWAGRTYCKDCYFKEYAIKYLGSAEKAGYIQMVYDAQGGRDLKTGKPLFPGQMKLVQVGDAYGWKAR